MQSRYLLAKSWLDIPGELLFSWFGDLPEAYRFVLILLLVAGFWPIASSVLSGMLGARSPVQNQWLAMPKWCAVVACLLIAASVLCFFVGRYNYRQLQLILEQVESYKRDNPISSTIFGVPITEQARAQVESMGAFAYSFVPPLTGLEWIVAVAFWAGVFMLSYGGRVFPYVPEREENRSETQKTG
jgi:hypothetical protein